MARDETTGRRGDARLSLRSRPGDALLIIDVLNDLEFPGGEKILPWALKLATRLAAFRAKAHRHGLPVIYANDNFGFWHSNADEVTAHATRPSARGREVGRRLQPGRRDYFILKPRHSAFFATSLIPLLEDLGVKRLILAGIATNLCVLFTAHDAHMHGYPMLVLSDCCAAESDFDHNFALGQLQRFCAARVCLGTEFGFTTLPTKQPH
ncbi:MAG TPA: isochorismatase family cysteine hydrolase [Tepidisphaeraceae bacterium]|jgi:nicotinamidase-related amidase|nr:isochorismatase family cysteine hydrolase [Tepidisphaeraceae bacterium]